MEIVIGVVVVVAGWLVNEHFARRAVRRNMRIEYLLSAYRRLEHASNREMTLSHEAALEEAISLSGSRLSACGFGSAERSRCPSDPWSVSGRGRSGRSELRPWH